MQLVRIEPGEFRRGNCETTLDLERAFPHYEVQRILELTDEIPPRSVQITRPYYLGRHAVTIGEFRTFVEATGYCTEAESDGTGGYGYCPRLGDFFEVRKPEYSWRNTGFAQADDHPVVNVSWHDAVAFCTWLSQREGAQYRLPTEAEWEYACRAGTTSRYHCGDEPESLVSVANLFDAHGAGALPAWRRFALAASDGYSFTAPVGSFRPNAFGLCDMHGNVWEWCGDWFAPHAADPQTDPTGPNEQPAGRVIKGGDWYHDWSFARPAQRYPIPPMLTRRHGGFRVVREVAP